MEPAYSIIHRICTILFDIYLPVTLFNENRKHGNPELTLLIAGKGDVSPFLLDRMCDLETKTTKQGRKLIWKISSMCNSQVNAIFIEADRCFSRFLSSRGFVAVPEWVLFTMDISMTAEEIIRRWKRRAKRNLRLIKRYKYEYEVNCDRKKLYFFYHNMFLPYIGERFRNLCLLASFGYMENLLQNGVLLLVKRGNEFVSGVLIATTTSIPIVAFLGVKDGREDYVKQGAISALYYYTILWAKERGFTEMDFGHCRPILNDGILLYKRRLGMGIHRSSRKHRILYISIVKLNSYLEQFLIDNPLIYDDQGKLKGLVFFQERDQPTLQEIEDLKRKYYIPGLEGFTVVSNDKGKITKGYISTNDSYSTKL